MAYRDIQFVKGQGGRGRSLPGQDYVSGAIFYGTAPAGFSVNNIQKILSVSQAESLGILNNYNDETKASGSYLITAMGNTGDVIVITVNEPYIATDGTQQTKPVVLCTYTKLVTDTSIAILGASITAAINANTSSTGYSATFNTATITFVPRSGLGIALNTGTPIAATITGTIAGTITQFTGGSFSKQAIWHYHISEYFRLNPNGVLWTMITTSPSAQFAELYTLATYPAVAGSIRQVMIYDTTSKTASALCSAATAIHTQELALEVPSLNMPLSVLYTADIHALTLTGLTDLNTLAAYKCSIVIGQDGGGVGANLYLASGITISNIGACLGTVSLVAVSEDIGQLTTNVTDGVENNVVAFYNGALVAANNAAASQLAAQRYIFLVTYTGYAGSYWNDSHTACVSSSDYAYIEDNRTIDKALRGCRADLLPRLKSKFPVNPNGTPTNVTIELFTNNFPDLDAMVRDEDLSSYTVTMDDTQNITATGKVIVAVNLVSEAIGRNITVNIGF